MKIIEVEVYQVDLPYAGGVYKLSGGRTYTSFDSTIVCIRTDTGLEGWGESTPFGPNYDAAIATAAALTVVEPIGCGLGGDAFALVWSKGQLHGLNGNGHAPAALTIDAVKASGHEQMPLYGWTPVTVPGCPSAWAELSKRFGKLPFAELLQPAGPGWLSTVTGGRPTMADRSG